MDFRTGVSLVTHYGINATISQRLARTVLTIEVANALNCTSIHGITMQLPIGARVTSLRTFMDDGCSTHGQVKTLEEARETFVETATQGLPGAYVEARDAVTYSLQVSIRPLGFTLVELVLEELLRARVGEIEFQIPLVPNEEVDQLSLTVNIIDVGGEDEDVDDAPTANATTPPGVTGTNFRLDLGSDIAGTELKAPFHLNIPDAREHDLPRVLRGFYNPRALPDEGVLYTDGRCFEHFFLPSSIESKPKNVLFLFDTVGWHANNNANGTKWALKDFIDTLGERDTLTIQTFARRGTEHLWGSAKATKEEKTDAKAFVDKLNLNSYPAYDTNLHEGERTPAAVFSSDVPHAEPLIPFHN
jgi:hypothetical protein